MSFLSSIVKNQKAIAFTNHDISFDSSVNIMISFMEINNKQGLTLQVAYSNKSELISALQNGTYKLTLPEDYKISDTEINDALNQVLKDAECLSFTRTSYSLPKIHDSDSGLLSLSFASSDPLWGQSYIDRETEIKMNMYHERMHDMSRHDLSKHDDAFKEIMLIAEGGIPSFLNKKLTDAGAFYKFHFESNVDYANYREYLNEVFADIGSLVTMYQQTQDAELVDRARKCLVGRRYDCLEVFNDAEHFTSKTLESLSIKDLVFKGDKAEDAYNHTVDLMKSLAEKGMIHTREKFLEIKEVPIEYAQENRSEPNTVNYQSESVQDVMLEQLRSGSSDFLDKNPKIHQIFMRMKQISNDHSNENRLAS